MLARTLLLATALLPAQPPAKQSAPSTKPEDLASISGQVVNAVTGEPVSSGLGQCVIVPLGFPTLSSPTWPRSTCANACETNG